MTTERATIDLGHAHVVAQVLLARLQERGVQPTRLKVEVGAIVRTRGDTRETIEMSVKIKLWSAACFDAVCDALRPRRSEESGVSVWFDLLGCVVGIVHVTDIDRI